MSANDDAPLGLYKAGLKFQANVNRLCQEAAQSWLGFGHQLIADGIAESGAEVDALLGTDDWQKLAALPGEVFWRQVQQRFDDTRAAAQIAITVQTTYSAGLQDAWQAWQKETADAAGRMAAAQPWHSAWSTWLTRRE